MNNPCKFIYKRIVNSSILRIGDKQSGGSFRHYAFERFYTWQPIFLLMNGNYLKSKNSSSGGISNTR